MKELLMILFLAILTNNFVLVKFLGICPFLGVSKKLGTAASMAAAVTVVMVMATAVTWPVYYYLLVPNGLEYMQTILFILIIAALVQLLEVVLHRYSAGLYKALGIYLPLITTNCAVLGVTVLVITEGYTFLQAIINSLGAGIGFLLAMVLFAGVRSRLETADIPKALQGLPITLMAAAIVALSFLGLGGVIENIFA